MSSLFMHRSLSVSLILTRMALDSPSGTVKITIVEPSMAIALDIVDGGGL